MTIEKPGARGAPLQDGAACLDRIREILAGARSRALQSVNAAMIAAYWQIGREIVEEEQRGHERAGYGERLIEGLSTRLSAEFGRGFSARNLRFIRQFFLTYPDRVVPFRCSPGSELPAAQASGDDEIRNAARTESTPAATTDEKRGFSPHLSWTHYRILMRVTDPAARSFYEVECDQARWSVRELERQVASLLFERLARSRDKDGVLALAREGHEVFEAADLVKDPYVLEFTGLPESSRWQESDLESALVERLQHFLLELGRDLFFVARQQRLTLDGDHFYVDLVFYHRVLRTFLLIDLKVGKLMQQDIGQMLLYTGYYEHEVVREDENPPVGLILCTEKNEAVVRYTLSGSAQQVFASRYLLHLPSEQELAEELRRERVALETSKEP
jgi:predicted nuclease of restriction endonuclease-like (RecB) superfamily